MDREDIFLTTADVNRNWERIATGLKDPRRCRRCGCPHNHHQHIVFITTPAIMAAGYTPEPCSSCACTGYRRARRPWVTALQAALRPWHLIIAALVVWGFYWADTAVFDSSYGSVSWPWWVVVLMVSHIAVCGALIFAAVLLYSARKRGWPK